MHFFATPGVLTLYTIFSHISAKTPNTGDTAGSKGGWTLKCLDGWDGDEAKALTQH